MDDPHGQTAGTCELVPFSQGVLLGDPDVPSGRVSIPGATIPTGCIPAGGYRTTSEAGNTVTATADQLPGV